MRATTLVKQMLGLKGVVVREISLSVTKMIVELKLPLIKPRPFLKEK